MLPLINMPIIDSHIHLWDIEHLDYAWLDKVIPIRKSYFIEDYQDAVKDIPVEKMVFIQAECRPEQFLAEVNFVEEQAQKDNRIQGIVAYSAIELGKQVEPILKVLQKHPLIKGIRRMYDDAPGLCCSSAFIDGLHLLPLYGFTFDISITPNSIPDTIKMIKSCPGTLFILDHLGKPGIKAGSINDFKKNIGKLAAFPNVVAKLSGIITEADWKSWTTGDISPYIEHAVNCFGYDRLMFGSDWPVLLLAGTWQQWLTGLQEILGNRNSTGFQKIFYKNAIKIYRL
ncbi:MAG: amidohydrolase family protein [Ginsengibacter sp.]